MADMIRWAPARSDLRRMQQDLDNWFTTLWSQGPEGVSKDGWPRADIYEDPEGLRLDFEVPGLDPKDVTVTLENGVLTVGGERKLRNEEKRENYHRIERSYGAFTRSFSLPTNLDTEKVRAEYKNGLLNVFIPRSERSKPKSIAVKVEAK